MKIVRRQLAALASAGAVLLSLSACDNSPEAPTDMGTCWRLKGATGARGDFAPVSNGVRNLETCAANLEAVSMREKTPQLTGAFQGQYVFITPEMVQSSLRLNGARYRLFDAQSRAKIDRKLQWMLEDAGHPTDLKGPEPTVYKRHISPPRPPTP